MVPLAEMLRLNGFATAAFGKSHETAAWEVSPSGPTDRWPTRCGFDKFYGFIGGEANQWAPVLYDGMTHVVPPKDPNYHLMTDMTNQAIAWVRCVKSLTPDKPFFLYFAPGATHAPHHVPKEWIARYHGQFDRGWDKLREETLARQKHWASFRRKLDSHPSRRRSGIGTRLTADEKKLFARQMEVFAGFGEYADTEIGRLIQAIEDLGQIGQHAHILHRRGQRRQRRGRHERPVQREFILQRRAGNRIRDPPALRRARRPHVLRPLCRGLGRRGRHALYLDQAGGLELRRHPQRDGRLLARSGSRPRANCGSQFHHVIDIAPTILEAAGIPEPKMVHGTPQTPIEGVSLVYTFADADGEEPARDPVLRDLRQPRHLP